MQDVTAGTVQIVTTPTHASATAGDPAVPLTPRAGVGALTLAPLPGNARRMRVLPEYRRMVVKKTR